VPVKFDNQSNFISCIYALCVGASEAVVEFARSVSAVLFLGQHSGAEITQGFWTGQDPAGNAAIFQPGQ
jgi:hypothetical protein